MTNWPGLIDVTARPTSSTMPQYSCPIGVGSVVELIPRYGQRSDPQTHVADILMTASVGSMIFGAGRMATCVIAVVGAAPCQCFSPGGNQITSPGRISSIGPPSRWTQPQPAVTMRV